MPTIRPLSLFLGFVGVACRHSVPIPEPAMMPIAEFRVGQCPAAGAVADSITDIVLRPKLKIPFFYSRHTDGEGRVEARLTIDTLGHAVPGSIAIVYSDQPRLSSGYCTDLLAQNYEVVRVSGRAQRARGNVSATFLGRGNAPPR